MPLNHQQSVSPRVHRILFVVLLIVSIVLATVYAREGAGGPLHAAQSAVMGVSGQVSSVGAGVGTATQAAGESVSDLTANPTTLTALREQNEELRQLLADAEEYRQEAIRLQGLLDMKQSSGVTGPVAHIIARSTNAWDRSVTIDLGAEEGVAGGMTVMGPNGVIGQVSKAQAHTSTVRLLTDPNSGAAVMIQSTRDDGIVRGSISGLLYLEDLDEDVIPQEGDIVVTSGLGGSYDRGLVVGTVVSVSKTESDSTGDVIVDPNGDVALFEEVIVVFSAPDAEAAEKAKKEADAAKAAQEAAAAQEAEGQSDDVYAEEGEYAEGTYVEGAADQGYEEYTEDVGYTEDVEYTDYVEEGV